MRTKSRFNEYEENDDMSSSDDDEEEEDSSSEEEEEDEESVVNNKQNYAWGRGGKQLRPTGGKQLRMPAENDKSDSSSSSESEEETNKSSYNVYRSSGGKQFRPTGGKQLRMPDVESEEESEEDSEDESEDEEEETNHAQSTAAASSLHQAVHHPVHRPAGGKILRYPPPAQEEDEDDDSSSESEEEEPQRVVIPSRYGGGKMMRPPPQKTEVDSESSEEEQFEPSKSNVVEDGVVSEPVTPKKNQQKSTAATESKQPKPKPKQEVKKDVDPSASDVTSESEEEEMDIDKFDTSQLITSKEDQKYLDSLQEFEREAILGQRFEKKKAEADMRRAMKVAKQQEREKRKSSSKSSTPKKAETPKEIKKEPETIKVEEKDESEEEELDFGDEDSDDDDYDGTFISKPWQRSSNPESTNESKDVKTDSDEEEAEDDNIRRVSAVEEASYDDYRRITIPRRLLAKWCNEPFFENALDECFVRLGIGPDKTGKPCYRFCKIVGVETKGNFYKFPTIEKGSKTITTNKLVRLQIGENKKTVQMILISDHRATQQEVAYYINQIKNGRLNKVLSHKQAMKILKEQTHLVHNYVYKNEDIEKNQTLKRRRGKVTNVGREFTRIQMEIQSARSLLADAIQKLEEDKARLNNTDDDVHDRDSIEIATNAVNDAQKLLEEKLHEQDKVLKAVEDRKNKLSQSSKIKKWALVNQKAQLMNQKSDLQYYKQDGKNENPFARRKVKPKNLWEVSATKVKKEDSTPSSKPLENSQTALAPQEGKQNLQNNNVYGLSHQFAINEDDLVAQTAAAPNGNNFQSFPATNGTDTKYFPQKRVRKGISMQEYLERKENGTL